MAWNLPEQKPPADIAAGFLQKLNCFEDGRFHPLRFSVLFALVLITAFAVHGLSAEQYSSLRSLFTAPAGAQK